MVTKTVLLTIPVEILESGCAGEFHEGAYPFGNPVLPLYTIRDCKRVMPVGRMMQQPDTGKGSQMPAYLFLTGITAAEHIP